MRPTALIHGVVERKIPSIGGMNPRCLTMFDLQIGRKQFDSFPQSGVVFPKMQQSSRDVFYFDGDDDEHCKCLLELLLVERGV